MKVFDCFTFFNEISLLKIRLEYLWDQVDQSVICESTYTHSGQQKPLYFELHKGEFSAWKSKIIHLIYEPDGDLPEMVRPEIYDPNAPQWTLERKQRDFLIQGLTGIAPGDAVVVSDVDEIWSSDLEPLLRDPEKKLQAARIEMYFFYYYINCIGVGPNNRRWRHPYFFRWSPSSSDLSLSPLRTGAKIPSIKEMGWHFSYLGGPEKIREKMEAFAHQEFNSERFKNFSHIESCLERGVDHLGREGVEWAFIPLSRLPISIATAAEKIPSLARRFL